MATHSQHNWLYEHCVHTLCFTSTVHCVLNTMLAKGMPLPLCTHLQLIEECLYQAHTICIDLT